MGIILKASCMIKFPETASTSSNMVVDGKKDFKMAAVAAILMDGVSTKLIGIILKS